MDRSAALGAALLLVIAAAPVAAAPDPAPLVTTEWLAAALGDPDLVVIELRPDAAFAAGHIAGALRSDYPGGWRTERDGLTWALPEIAELETVVGGFGIEPDDAVIIVPAGGDATEFGGATWLYWVLSYLGHEAVGILDGGYAAWVEDGRETALGAAELPEPASYAATPRPDLLATTADVLGLLGDHTMLVDARPAPAYAAGHIPGALALPNASLYDAATHRLLPAQELARLLPEALADPAAPIVTYCNTGHWGSIDWFVLSEVLGYTDVRLYAGSMAAWTQDPARPIETSP